MSIYFGAFSQHCTQGRPIGAVYMPTLDPNYATLDPILMS